MGYWDNDEQEAYLRQWLNDHEKKKRRKNESRQKARKAFKAAAGNIKAAAAEFKSAAGWLFESLRK